ncbi:uncharacterized protein LOC114294065 isoform X1 [Camellia sinensis]|uniref:uncharacterized protein LOC114294065 isoform X1 n=1 Tax=Camellia sinensis TaxID=4442 RepID=UPI0010361A69|nr:uncharacterized protein LOC114294065 isoform X1 [Camellia sinensis]
MVRVSRVLLGVRDGGFGISKSLLEILVCPLSKQPLRMCEQSNSLISDAIGVAYPIANGIPCLVPKDGKIIDTDDMPKPAGALLGALVKAWATRFENVGSSWTATPLYK